MKRTLRLVAPVILVAIASATVFAATRHDLCPPDRSLPLREESTRIEQYVPAEELMTLLARGDAEGTLASGANIELSIDEDLQQGVFELFRRFNPAFGVFAAVEPDTGRVVALVGYRRGGESDPSLPLKAVYPAASLFKIVTAAAAIERGGISPDEGIPYRGGIYSVTKRNIDAKSDRGAARMSLEEAIARSSNAVFGKVAANNVGEPVLEEYMRKFGFGVPIPFVLPVQTSSGEIPSDRFQLARTGAGFGEVYVSPLHMAMIMAAVGNGGAMPRPILIDAVRDADGNTLYADAAEKWADAVSPMTADTLARMMVKTVEMGTSSRTFGNPETNPMLADMQVAGKTGSLSGWNPRMKFEWFAGVAPVDGARLAVAALVVNGSDPKIKGSYVGKEAFASYFGYPTSLPPAYRRGGKKIRTTAVSKKKHKHTVRTKSAASAKNSVKAPEKTAAATKRKKTS